MGTLNDRSGLGPELSAETGDGWIRRSWRRAGVRESRVQGKGEGREPIGVPRRRKHPWTWVIKPMKACRHLKT